MIHRVEARIWAAVLLATAGCRPAAEPTPTDPIAPDPAPTESAPPSAEPMPVATSPSPSASALDSPSSAPPMSPDDARVLCETYKSKSDVKGRPSKPIPGTIDHWQPADQAVWSPATNTVFCTLVRERTTTTFQRMESTPCCPQGMPRGHKCPPPAMRTVRGERILVEVAEVRRDGSVSKSDLTTRTYDPHPVPMHACGRRPEGFSTSRSFVSSVGAELADMATLEAASVPAFDRLARELAFHGAPDALVARARTAKDDEIRHARVMTALARAEGHEPAPFDAEVTTVRDLVAIARENATEGCVVEAFGALLATFQAERAHARLRPSFEGIARDERRHAALAEDVHAWLASRLSAEDRLSVDEARKVAKTTLWESLASRSTDATLGTPTPDEARALFSSYFDG